MARASDLEMRVLGPGEEERVLAAIAPIRLEEPVEERSLRPEHRVLPEVLAITVPQHLARDAPPERAGGEPPEHTRKRVVEPDDGAGARPDDVAHLPVVARHHPGRPPRRLLGARAKRVGRGGGPGGLPVEGVEFHEGCPQPPGEPPPSRPP